MKKIISFSPSLFVQPHHLKAFNSDQGFILLDAMYLGSKEANHIEEAAKLQGQKSFWEEAE